MPLEIKQIYFTEEEVRQALINFSLLRKKYLDIDDIKKIEIKAEETISVSMLVDQALAKETEDITFSHAEVAAALIAFCMSSKIPMPKRGIKSLHANEEKIFLTIKLDEEVNFNQYDVSDIIKK